MNFSVTRDGKPLDESLYTWDEETRTFSSSEDCLVIDARGESYITFNTGSWCTFRTKAECIIIRRDIYEVIEIPANTKIKLNGDGIRGYNIIEQVTDKHIITIDGKDIALSDESYQELKKALR